MMGTNFTNCKLNTYKVKLLFHCGEESPKTTQDSMLKIQGGHFQPRSRMNIVLDDGEDLSVCCGFCAWQQT